MRIIKKDATKAIQEVLSKEKVPIIVGGTGLYVDSLIYNIDYPEIKTDLEYRKKLEKVADEEGLEKLYEMAKKIDERATLAISSNDRKRIIRILEIYHSTGKTKTEQEIESRKK
ncbi:MAG: tRNA dimethylallyltransferase [Clostridia bacterium]